VTSFSSLAIGDMRNAYLAILLICLFVALVIVAYGTIRCKVPNFYDPLTYSYLPAPWNNFLDGWGISHFGFYFMLTYWYPQNWFYIFCLGVVWELIEVVFKDHPFYLSRCNYGTDRQDDPHAKWWYGRWQDIVMNALGIALGLALRARRASP